MAFDDYKIDPEANAFGMQREEEPEESPYYVGQRGLIGDAASLIGRAGVSTLETIENAAEFFGMNDSDVDSASKLRQFDLFKPDIDEYLGRGLLQETALGSIPSAVESMGPSLLAAGSGFVLGQAALPFLPVAGGVIGAALASLGLMGTAEYQRTYEDAIQQGLSEDDASTLATKTGLVEGLGESAGSMIGLGPLAKPFMKPLQKIAGQGLKKTLKDLTSTNVKQMAKGFGKVYTGEQLTEFAQAGLQTQFLRDADMTDSTNIEAMLQTVVPTLFMTGAFQLGTNTLNAKKRKQIKEGLDPKNSKETRLAAARAVGKMLKGEDAKLSNDWTVFSELHIDKGEEIPWNDEFENFADQMNIAHTKQVLPDHDIINNTGDVAGYVDTQLNSEEKTKIANTYLAEIGELEAGEPLVQEEIPVGEEFTPQPEVITPVQEKIEEEVQAVQEEEVEEDQLGNEIGTKEVAQKVVDEIDKRMAQASPEMRREFEKVREQYVGLVDSLPSEVDLTEDQIGEIEGKGLVTSRNAADMFASETKDEVSEVEAVKELVGEGEQVAEEDIVEEEGLVTEAQVLEELSGQVSIDEAPTGETSARHVDVRGGGQMFEWEQDTDIAESQRTSSIIRGDNAGVKGSYYLIRDREASGTWIVMYKPSDKSMAEHVATVSEQDSEVVDGSIRNARDLAAEKASEHARAMGVTEWLDEGTNEKGTIFSITPTEGVKFIVTPTGKNAWTLELEITNDDGTTSKAFIKRKAGQGVKQDSQKDTWSSVSKGQMLKYAEEIGGFETKGRKKRVKAEQVTGIDQEGPTIQPRPEMTAEEGLLVHFRSVEDRAESEGTARKVKAPRQKLAAGMYSGEMTEEKLQRIKTHRAKLENALFQQPVNKDTVAIRAKLEDDILSLKTIEETPMGKKIKSKKISLPAKEITPIEPTETEAIEREAEAVTQAEETKAEIDRGVPKSPEPTEASPLEAKLIDMVDRIIQVIPTQPQQAPPQVPSREVGEVEVRPGEFEEELVPQEVPTEAEKQVAQKGAAAKAKETTEYHFARRSLYVDNRIAEDEVDAGKKLKGEAREDAERRYAEIYDRKLRGEYYGLGFTENDQNLWLPSEAEVQTRMEETGQAQRVLQTTLAREKIRRARRPGILDRARREEQEAQKGRRASKIKKRLRDQQGRAFIIEDLVQAIGRGAEKGYEGVVWAAQQLGGMVYKAGQSLGAFKQSLKKVAGKAWDTIKGAAKDLYEFNKLIIGNETGAITLYTEPVTMTSDQFLGLATSGQKTIDRLKEEGFVESPEGGEYEEGDQRAFEFDPELAEQAETPYLVINKDGKVVGHEGRHRAIFGPDTMNVELRFEGGQYPVGDIKPQFKGGENTLKETPVEEPVEEAKEAAPEAPPVPPKPKVDRTSQQYKDEVIKAQRQAPKKEGFLGKHFGKFGEWVGKMAKMGKEFVQPMNDALHLIHKNLSAMNRMHEANLSRTNKKQSLEMEDFFRGYSNLSEDDKALLKSGWINPDNRHLMDEVLKRNGLEEAFGKVQKIIKANESKLEKLGVIHKSDMIEDYLPRLVSPEGAIELYNALKETPEGQEQLGPVDFFIDQQRQKIERKGGEGSFTPEHRNEAIAQAMFQNQFNVIPRPGYTKQRKISHVPKDMIQHYENPMDTLVDYMYRTNELLYQRGVSGKSNRNQHLHNLWRQSKKVEAAADKVEKMKTAQAKLNAQDKLNAEQAEYDRLAGFIKDIDEDSAEAMNTQLEKLNLTEEEKADVMQLFRNRFAQRGTSGAIRGLKDVVLMTTIGNPMSAITQLGDQGFNLFDNGFYGMRGVVKAMTGNDLIDEFDIENYLREFSTESKTSNALDKLLTLSGLKRMDMVGKESYMQGFIAKAGNMSFEEFQKELGHYEDFLFESTLKETHDSMVSGKPNKDALYIGFSELSTRQPTTLSETSTRFQTAGNGRLFWTLKQFALRALSSAVTDAKVEFNEGNYVKGVAKATSLMLILAAAGAGTDELKNIILGREGESLPDAVVSNLMDLLFMNRYSLESGITKGKPFTTLLTNNVLPPTRLADDIINDVWKTSQGDFSYKTMSHVPLVGRISYEYSPLGRQAETKRVRRAIMELASDGAKFGELQDRVREYNKDATGDPGLEKITAESFRSARRRAKEDE
jgi:hypothetical protein